MSSINQKDFENILFVGGPIGGKRRSVQKGVPFISHCMPIDLASMAKERLEDKKTREVEPTALYKRTPSDKGDYMKFVGMEN